MIFNFAVKQKNSPPSFARLLNFAKLLTLFEMMNTFFNNILQEPETGDRFYYLQQLDLIHVN